ncbi:MAG: hypothetical protein QMD12_00885 [Candidatus Aenigmarchaeota archaeon]|nr:hypothetical protein [Candidatus Aenigmarchaeota archaeon]
MIKKNKFFVHAWQLNGFARLNIKFIRKLEARIKNKPIKYLAKDIGISTFVLRTILRRGKRKRSCARIKNIFTFIDFLGLQRDEVERNIEHFKLSSSVEWENAKIKFPLEVNPLWFRCVGVGDFSVGYNKWRYYVIWHQNSTKPMRDLIDNLVGISPYFWLGGYSEKNERLLIPSIIVDACCSILNISRKEITTTKFIKACLRLPKAYRIQVLAQTIVDDGYCDKVHNRVSIHMKNKQLIQYLHKLCQSLSYPSTIITRSMGRHKTSRFYDLILTVEGTFKFYNDLKQMMKIHGDFAGLWNKQDRLEEVVKKIDLKRLRRIEENREYRHQILQLMKKGIITTNELIDSLKIPRTKFFNLMYDLKKKGLVKSIRKGIYSLCR